jgi:hypothetical protein
VEALRQLPRHVAIAAVSLALAVGLVELVAAASSATLSPPGTVEAVLIASPVLLVLYAAPLLGVLPVSGFSAWPLAALVGLLPGVVLGFFAGLVAYGALVGAFAGLASVALRRLLGTRKLQRGSQS